MTNRISKAVEEFYSSSTIAPLLDIKTEDMQDFCYQHKIKTKIYDDGNESKLFVSGKSLQDHLARSKVSDQANTALKWQALKQSIDSKNNKRIKLFPKSKELPTCTEMPEGFVDTKEAARMLGIHRDSIFKHINEGKLDVKKIKSKKCSYGFVYAVSIRSCEDYKNNVEEMPEGFVDIKEAARMLGLSVRSIRDYISAGKLDTKKIKHRGVLQYVVSISSCEDYKSKYKEMPEGFVDTKEAARMLGLSVYSICNYISAGELDAKKIKRRSSGAGFAYAVSIRSCEDWMEKKGHLRNVAKKVGTTYNKVLKVKEILEAGDKGLIKKLKKEEISIDTAYKKIRTKKEDKMNQDNNSKLPSIDLYMLSRVIDLNTLALVYPNLRDWLAENRNATIREFIVDTIKQMDHLSKNYKHGE